MNTTRKIFVSSCLFQKVWVMPLIELTKEVIPAILPSVPNQSQSQHLRMKKKRRSQQMEKDLAKKKNQIRPRNLVRMRLGQTNQEKMRISQNHQGQTKERKVQKKRKNLKTSNGRKKPSSMLLIQTWTRDATRLISQELPLRRW